MDTTISIQDLGELSVKVYDAEEKSVSSGATKVYPSRVLDTSHIGALEKIREALEEAYGDCLDDLSDEDEELVITRVAIPSDDVPTIEYSVVSDRKI